MSPPPASIAATPYPSRLLAGIGYLVCIAVAIFGLLTIVGHIGLVLWPSLHHATVTDPLPTNPVYAHYPWAADCLREQLAKQRNAYVPFLLWGNSETHG